MTAPYASLLMLGIPERTLSGFARDWLARGLGGVILFRHNLGTPAEVADLTNAIGQAAARGGQAPTLIGVDQEGGRVRRLVDGFTPIPAMRRVGELGDPAVAYEVGRLLAWECRAVGFNLDFAPVLDVDTNPANPVIGERSFGRDPQRVARLGLALARGLLDGGVLPCAKHFPGHGDTSQDSHKTLPVLPHDMQRLEAVELVPFQAACGDVAASGHRPGPARPWADPAAPAAPPAALPLGPRGALPLVMTAHVVFPALDPDHPATLSPRVITPLLRQRLGFEGVVVSDDFEMNAIAERYGMAEATERAITAGVDLILCCHRQDRQEAILGTLERLWNGPQRARLEASVVRVQRLRRCLAPFVPVDPTAVSSLVGQPQARQWIHALVDAGPPAGG